MLNYANAQMQKCTNAQMLKCKNAQMRKCSTTIHKCTNAQLQLRKCDAKGKVGVAVHEYANSLNITNEWPYLLGRLHYLFDACDNHSIAYPPVAITEWGWEACDVKLPPSDAVADIDQVWPY